MLTVYGSSLIRWEVDGKVFVQTLIVVGPMITQVIFGLDFLRGCSIDLVNHVLTTSDGQVIIFYSQNNNNKQTPVLFVTNVRIPLYSELELMADVSGGVQPD